MFNFKIYIAITTLFNYIYYSFKQQLINLIQLNHIWCSMKKILIILISLMIYPVTLFAKDLLIFGDRNHDVFLGCITCNE